MNKTTQFSVTTQVKDRFDRFKADNKEKILSHAKAKRRLATNDLTLQYLLSCAGSKR